jgi:hypothetical protein
MPGNRLYFLSTPPPMFAAITSMVHEHARAKEPGYTRLMIEKPFGRDSETFEVMLRSPFTIRAARVAVVRALALYVQHPHPYTCRPHLAAVCDVAAAGIE